MTEYWVSQGNYWCEYCRIWLANNTASIRMHEHGEKHKKAVAQKLRRLQQDASNQERERKEAEATIGRIERMAQRQFEKDKAEQLKAEQQRQQQHLQQGLPGLTLGASSRGQGQGHTPLPPPATAPPTTAAPQEDWVFDDASGYFYNSGTGYYYDSDSGLYYSDALGKWATEAEVHKAAADNEEAPSPAPAARPGLPSAPTVQGQLQAAQSAKPGVGKLRKAAEELPPGPIRKRPAGSLPAAVGRGVQSSVAVDKKRKSAASSTPVSAEEAAARAAREAAKKRTEERDKKLMGLYSAFG